MTKVSTLGTCVGVEKVLHDTFAPVAEQLSDANGTIFRVSGSHDGREYKLSVNDELADHLAKTYLLGTFGGASDSRGPNTGRGLASVSLLVHDQGDNQLTLGQIAQGAQTYGTHLRQTAGVHKADVDRGREVRPEAA